MHECFGGLDRRHNTSRLYAISLIPNQSIVHTTLSGHVYWHVTS